MKLTLCIIALLLSWIAYRVPTAREIGEGVLQAQLDYESRLRSARIEREAKEMGLDAESQRAAAKVRAATELNARQAEFDALPKWDALGQPINRTPPAGLAETRAIPPSTFRPIISATPPPAPEKVASEIERKYGSTKR